MIKKDQIEDFISDSAQTAIDGKATDANVLHKTGNETKSDNLKFLGEITAGAKDPNISVLVQEWFNIGLESGYTYFGTFIKGSTANNRFQFTHPTLKGTVLKFIQQGLELKESGNNTGGVGSEAVLTNLFRVRTDAFDYKGNEILHAGNTAGKFMLADLTQKTDPNTVFTNSANRFASHANNPTNDIYSIITFGNGGNVTSQIASRIATGETYIRAYNTTWSAWRKLFDDVNIEAQLTTIARTYTAKQTFSAGNIEVSPATLDTHPAQWGQVKALAGGRVIKNVSNADFTSGNYTFVLEDKDKFLVFAATSSATLTIPSNIFDDTHELRFMHQGIGSLTIANASGVYLRSDATKVVKNGGVASIKIQTPTSFLLSGDLITSQSLTGTVISLSSTSGNNYNYATPSTATTYTTTTPIINGFARCFINAASEPTVTGATKIAGATFVANTNMEMVVESPDGVAVRYFFLEI